MPCLGSLRRCRPWLLFLVMGLGAVLLAAKVQADEPAPDPTGAYMTTPTTAPSGSVPGYEKPDPKTATLEQVAIAVDKVAQSTSRNFFAANYTWTLVAGFLVMFMQAGFALVETGLCRAKNAAHVMSMNFLVYALGMFGFFVCGYALMCGGVNDPHSLGGPATLGGAPTLNSMFTVGDGWGLFGKSGFFLTGKAYDSSAIVWFLFMMVFMDTTATIPTGALAERWTFKSFFIFSIFIGAITYPIYGCWVWGGGWLAQLGTKAGIGHGLVDYAGSSVVHLQGGALALITCILLGPRIGKYDENGKARPILGHHIPMVMLGTFILAFGWFGFNAGSSLAATDGRIGIVAVNTMIAGMSATLSGVVYMWVRYGKPDPSMMCNSMLAGLVAITAPCAFVTPVGAFTIGLVSGVLVVVSVFFWDRMGVDDPVGAISVHGVNGAWGVLALGLFADGSYGDGYNGVAGGVGGLLYGFGAKQLVAQAIGVAVCAGWNIIIGGSIFWAIGKVFGSNRVAAEIEIAGLDIPEMGAPGYPEFIAATAPEEIASSDIAAARRRLAVT